MASLNKRLSYYDFADQIDIERFEEAIEFEVLSNKGDEDIGKCPDFWGLHKHGDTTGKFAINRQKKVWHCFLCDGGNLLSLAMAFLQTDEDAATEWLYQFAEDTRSRPEIYDDFLQLLKKHESKSDQMPYFNDHVLDQFESTYIPWFEKRGISEKVMKDFGILSSKYHKKTAPIKAQKKIDDDYYGPCVVFPHYWQKRLVGWQHRWLDHGKNTPKWLGKYTNVNNFPKHSTLYNFDRAIKRDQPVIVVESVPTVLFLESFGYSAVSSFGSGIKPEQIKLLQHFDNVIVSPDNDKAGQEFAQKITSQIRNALVLPAPSSYGEGADLGDISGRMLDQYINSNLSEPDYMRLR